MFSFFMQKSLYDQHPRSSMTILQPPWKIDLAGILSRELNLYYLKESNLSTENQYISRPNSVHFI